MCPNCNKNTPCIECHRIRDRERKAQQRRNPSFRDKERLTSIAYRQANLSALQAAAGKYGRQHD